MSSVVRFILPMKNLGTGKSRLQVPGVNTADLVAAMLADTIEATVGTGLGRTVVVTGDADVIPMASRLGAEVLLHQGGLNEAITAALVPGMCAALLPDVPAVTVADLLEVLDERVSGYVSDRHGTGTTMIFGPRLEPKFGPGSAARHASAELPRIDMSGRGISVDVDTADDLRAAARIGLGRHSAALMKARGADPQQRIGPSND